MKKNFGAPDYSGIEDRRIQSNTAPRPKGSNYGDGWYGQKPDNDAPISNYTQKSDKYNAPKSYDISQDPATQASIASALGRMSYKIDRAARNLPDMSDYNMSAPLPSRKRKSNGRHL